MFFRTKLSGTRSYLQIVENRWEDGRTRQRVVATLGRLDQLRQSGQLDALLAAAIGSKHQVTQLKKAGVAALELKRLSPPSGQLLWLATPKLLRK